MSALPGKRFVLVADDNRDLAWGLTILLKLAGFDVKTVHDGRAAVAALAERVPDIVLLDIGLPDFNGFEVAQRIRAMQGTRAVLVIAISGYHPSMVQANLPWSSFDHHFVKPVDFDTL